ncbi:MAG TPA: hypothetical protein VG389_14410 [Myxococcota bacterium]|nr:hypothetical protein [Myxococcota bacterium]
MRHRFFALLRATAPVAVLAVLAAAGAAPACGGGEHPPNPDAAAGTDSAPIVLNTDAVPAGTDSGPPPCSPACSGGGVCIHPCNGGPPFCFTPPMGCSGCSFSCDPCAGAGSGTCGATTPTDVYCMGCM